MTSLLDGDDVITQEQRKEPSPQVSPSLASLHKRRRGEPPASLSVRTQTSSDPEGSSPCTAPPTADHFWSQNEPLDSEALCDSILQRLKDKDDPVSKRGKDVAAKTKETSEVLDQLEKLLELLDQFLTLKEQHGRLLKRLRDVNYLKRLHDAHKKIESDSQLLKYETKEIELLNEVLDEELEHEYGQAIFESMVSGRSMKRSGSKWRGQRFGGSLLRRGRARSAGGGEDGDVTPSTPNTPLRRRSDGVFAKEVDKSKVSKWTRVKAAFRWEKAQWTPASGAAGAVAAGALVGAVALAGSAPAPSHPPPPEPRDSASLTPGSALSLTPNSSCEELAIDSGASRKSTLRCDENDNTFLHAPTQDDSSTSPSPNKLHKSPWVKMRDIIQTRRESVKKKPRDHSGYSGKFGDSLPPPRRRRRSLSDSHDSDAPPQLTLTIPSSEQLECSGSPSMSAAPPPAHPPLRKQRSLELMSRPPPRPRPSKWSKVKRAFLTSASASVPSSPSRHSAFFTDPETECVSSGCEGRGEGRAGVRDEIARDYAALQTRLSREISDRHGKLYASSRPVATEEQLSADFRKKLAEWQRMKGERQPPPVPARRDLSDDFLKKWDEWKHMKDTNTVPAWEEEAKPDEVLVQTSTGLFKFQGISRSFTRKLHEWEKSRGIAPEASTSALLRAARAGRGPAPAAAPLTRAMSAGSVAPSDPASGAARLHASSLSVNDADDLDSEYERSHSPQPERSTGSEGGEGVSGTRGAVLVEVFAEEVLTAAPLLAVWPRAAPHTPVYRAAPHRPLYCTAPHTPVYRDTQPVTHTAAQVMHPEVSVAETQVMESRDEEQKTQQSTTKRNREIRRQPSIEEDAMFIRKTIEEIERGSSGCIREEVDDEMFPNGECRETTTRDDAAVPSTSKGIRKTSKYSDNFKETRKEQDYEFKDDFRRKEPEKNNLKKKSKSRARLEREQSKPSETDSEPEIDTVTVEIPRRRKRPRRPSERPRTPPTSLHSDSEGEVFVLKLKAPEPREGSPEVIVKTTRKIFSPVVRIGESIPRAVIPLDVEDLAGVTPTTSLANQHNSKKHQTKTRHQDPRALSKSSGDLQENEEQRPRSKPPLPLSPSSQRKPQPKETAPSIRIMIQRYNMKINEEAHTSPNSSGTSSPAWRSPKAERRRPPDMPVGVNIRNNPFLEREVQKSASACQLSRQDQASVEKQLTPTTTQGLDGVLKSHSANALHPENRTNSPLTRKKMLDKSQETIKSATASTDTIVPDLTRDLPVDKKVDQPMLPVMRQMSDTIVPTISRFLIENREMFERSIASVESPPYSYSEEAAAALRLSDRAARIRAARERFLSSPVQRRRDGTGSASDLRLVDRCSRISCESDVTESQSSSAASGGGGGAGEGVLGRSASTGMVNVERDAWQRVTEGSRRERDGRTRSRFSLSRLAAKLRRKDDSGAAGAVSRLCRQSLLVQLRNKP